jgi:hypothetical protein
VAGSVEAGQTGKTQGLKTLPVPLDDLVDLFRVIALVCGYASGLMPSPFGGRAEAYVNAEEFLDA